MGPGIGHNGPQLMEQVERVTVMKKFIVRILPRAAVLLMYSLLRSQSAFGLENEVWISPNSIDGTNVTTVSSTDVIYGSTHGVLYPSNVVGTPTYPFRCQDATSLNYVLTSVLLNTNMTVHFMAGTFQVANTIAPLTGWKLRGAGIDSTILQLASGTVTSSAFLVISKNPSDGVEVSDMTIDCNFQGQNPGAGAITAVGLAGSQTRISRVKAINWGTGSSGGEDFVLSISCAGASQTNYATNVVIEDCIVTQPTTATVSASEGVTAIDVGPYVRGGVTRNNMVYNINTTTGPAWIHALTCAGTVRQNYVWDLFGNAMAAYHDSWSMADQLIDGNVFDNVSGGIMDYSSTWETNIVYQNNIMRIAENGVGINYYNGAGNNNNPGATNILINNNISYPSVLSTAYSIQALALNGYVTASVMDNVFQGAPGNYGADLFMNYGCSPSWFQGYYPYDVTLNTWRGNVNLLGTQLKDIDDTYWQPGEEDSVIFTPTSNGWYRLMTNGATSSGTITLEADWAGGPTNEVTDVEFVYAVNGDAPALSGLGQISEIRKGAWASQVTQARIGADNPSTTGGYVDIYVNDYLYTRFIRVKCKGHFRERLLNPPIGLPGGYAPAFTNTITL